MNKNPFVAQPTYTPAPPLPPGPPPPQPTQPDYSAYWAAVQQQQAPAGSYAQQWPAQAPRPTPEQNALYANYGYGAQWQRQQQQQQQQQPQQFHTPPPVVQPPPPQPAPGYNPYQPAVTYAQPYVPQAPQAMTQTPYNPMGRPLQPPSQPMFNPHIPPQPVPPIQPQQQQQRHGNHASLQHQPPAKRQRFDGPPAQQRQTGQQQQFQPPLPPSQPHSGGRGGGPGSNQMPLGGRGGRGNSIGNMGRGRGGSMNPGRGGMNNRNVRGGGSYNAGPNNAGRGGAGLRGHNSRGHLGGNKDYHNRRGGSFNSGGGSFSHQNTSFRGRGFSHSNSNRSHGSNTSVFGKEAAAPGSTLSGKKDENRRTLTDFKMVGLEIPDLSWSWGLVGSKIGDDVKAEDIDQLTQVIVKVESMEDDTLVMNSSDTIASETKNESSSSHASLDDSERKDTDAELKSSFNGAPHSRVRIYFHTPVSADDSHPILPNSFSIGTLPSDSRKGKRKKLDDDEDGDGEDGRRPAPHISDDRSSVAASVTHSVAESGSEADWLMAAITDGEQTQPDPDADGDEDDDERLHVSEIVEYHDTLSEMGDGEEEHGGESRLLCVLFPVISSAAMAHATNFHFKVSQGNHDGAENHNSVDATPVTTQATEIDTGSIGAMIAADPESAPAPAVDTISSVSLSSAKDDQPLTSSPASVSEAISSVSVPYASHSYSDDHVNHTEHADVQVTAADPIAKPISDSLVASASSTQEAKTQPESLDQGSQEHLPEPPVSPVSNTLLSTSSSSTYGDTSSHASVKLPTTTPSANRLSISYASGNRRIVINAEVVESMQIHRSEGRIEVKLQLQYDADKNMRGILVEGRSDVNKGYAPLSLQGKDESEWSDSTIPPFVDDTASKTVTLIAYLDTKRPLSEPRWLRTGDIQDWLKSIFGRMFWVAGDAAEGWEKKITVVDPDPPPTIWTVLDGWVQNSPVGVLTERQRFLKTHLSETENILEILLRLVRGERATAFSSSSMISAPSVSGPLLSALSQGTAHGSQQTHVSLAVLAMYQIGVEYATKASGESGKKEVDERIGEIIRCLPSHLIYKSLDGIFKEWRVEKKGR
ncbi:hypothetical protein GYMLUDRAFT_70680 [Collybiopsis luxurians FD-317 M1]|nr:hypothetical protein GYMLUDRAFT_70680 [Collybiopsis luxurians FD-317 M1]